MIRIIGGLLAALLCAVLVFAQEGAKLPPISIEELKTRPVIGELGIPLGTVAEINAIVISGRELRSKADSGAYLLKVTHVNQKQLAEPCVIHFNSYRFHQVNLANNSFALHEMKYGKPAKSLRHDLIQEMEQGYVGKSVRLAVYEEGVFRGMPAELPEDVVAWQDVGFGFQTSLIVLADRAPPAEDDDYN